MVLRRDVIRERLAKLEEIVSRLADVAGVSRQAFHQDWTRVWIAERGLQLGAQAVLDVANHLLAGHFGEAAREYEEILQKLGQHGVLSATLGARLRGLGGMRNVLVHGYLSIDVDRVYDALQAMRADFTDFQAEILAWLDRMDAASG